MGSEDYALIGTHQPLIDSSAKASGQAKFTADMVFPRLLTGKILGSPYPHARVLAVDASRALALKGVKAVVTGKDIPGVPYGTFESRRDETGLAMKARYVGDPVAAVAAVDEDTARSALDLIKVEYEVLPAVFEPEEAMKDGAPLIDERFPRNIVAYRGFNFGDVEKGFAESDYVREDRFFSQPVNHAALEPRATIAEFDITGKLTLWTSTQAPYNVQRDLSLVLAIPRSQIHVIKPYVGGGFGGKGELNCHQVITALLAMKTGTPVQICLTREEEISITRLRSSMIVYVKTGVKKDGALMAQHLRCIADSGAYASTSILLMYNAGLTCLIPYRLANFKYEGTMVYTNRAVTGPMRGHGANQPRFAVESQLDMIAHDLGLDPAELRLRNATQAGDTSVNGLIFNSCELTRAIEESTKAVGWQEKRGRRSPYRGIGLACGGFVCGARSGGHTASACFIQINIDGGVTVMTGSSDIGQGSKTVVAMTVAEELGLPLSQITVVSADTETTPIEPGTFSSRVTFYAGNAGRAAARDVKAKMVRAAVRLLEGREEDILFRDGRVYVKGNPDRAIAFEDLARTAITAGHGGVLIGTGYWVPTNTSFPDRKTYYGNVSGAYSFACQVAEVEVNPETGQVRLVKLTIGDDCGQVINALEVEGQAEGSAAMGIGHALMEEIVFGRNGAIMNPSLLDYRIPTALDCGETALLEVGKPDPVGPFGAKEIGEGLLIATVPAIVNAIYDATGIRFTELPITPEKVLRALEKKEPPSC